MVRELKELVDSLASIDTTVDIEDVQQIAGLQPDIDIKIRTLREFLLSLHIEHVDVPVPALTETEPELTPTVPEVVETLAKLYTPTPQKTTEIPLKTATTDSEFKELLELGFTETQLKDMKALYDARKSSKKMSFVVCMKACKFVSDKLKASKVRILKSKIVPLLSEYLKIIDPDVEYNVCNVHDFLKGVALGNISKRFFKFENGYLTRMC